MPVFLIERLRGWGASWLCFRMGLSGLVPLHLEMEHK